ncbi:hypothetical protein Ancab_039745 [Ancistrocladus abbreviatus]
MASSSSATPKTKINPLFSCDDIHEDDELFLSAAQMVNSMAFSMVLNAAIELGVLEIIANAGPRAQLSVVDIASQLPTSRNPNAPAILDKMLHLLANFSVLSSSTVAAKGDAGAPQGVYGLAPVAKYLVRDEDGVCLGPLMSLFHDRVLLQSWSKLQDAILEGGTPFNLVHGVHAFEYPGLDSRFNKVFNTAMFNFTANIVKKIIQSYKGFENINELVDVGGGVGNTLKAIISKYPNIKGINFDLPHVIQHALPCSGMKHVSGNMFESVPSGDAIWMKGILHDWSDDDCIKLLKNCYKALPRNGKVIIVNALVAEELETSTCAKFISLMDVTMMTQVREGKERTWKEFQALANAAGFTNIKLVCKVYCDSIMEFYK